jgi:hypothetical protein
MTTDQDPRLIRLLVWRPTLTRLQRPDHIDLEKRMKLILGGVSPSKYVSSETLVRPHSSCAKKGTPQPTMYSALPSIKKTRDTQLSLVTFSIRTLLTKGSTERLPATYEGIYTACRSLVCISDSGEMLFNNLKKEVDQCMTRLSRILGTSESSPVEWIKVFTDVCQWFETQVVSNKCAFIYSLHH